MTGALIQIGSAGGYVELESTYLSADLDINTASASIRFQTDGEIQNQNGATLGQWHYPAAGSPGDSYEIRATANPDTPDSGTMNTWLALSSNRLWTESRTSPPGVGTDEVVFDIEIRGAGGGSAIASTTVTLRAEVVI
jgi:hypothetical protein